MGQGVTEPVVAVIDAVRRAGLLLAAPELPVGVTHLTADSRAVVPGSLFLALPGTQTDGHAFVADAAARGAALVLVERPTMDAVPQLVVRDARAAAVIAARAWYGDPSASMVLVGITGTNGKTTTTGIMRHLLNRRGDAGSIGTLGAFDGQGAPVPSAAGSLTTPGPVDLQATFARLAERGVARLAMEASSHSLDQGRLDGLLFQGAVFTNLTRDHLDYHRTMEAYLAAKLRLLGLMAPGAAIAVNADDRAWDMIPPSAGRISFGLEAGADLRATDLVLSAEGSRFVIEGRFGRREVRLPLPGEFNVANALGAAACALGLGQALDEVAERLTTAPQVPGRLERLTTRPCAVLRDYAHTPDALARVLHTLRPLTRGRLVVVFGCGGDRDRGKRPLMGQVVADLADLAIVTSDNPRTEDPEAILDEILAGMPARDHLRIADRREAIGRALELAADGDTVLLAGKGHEDYQIIGTTKYPFDEGRIVRELVGP
jgi:UDP-N-acetylmuramoyl-L-alanyl-D-glutamate--2,6-diaminopimelate ligase